MSQHHDPVSIGNTDMDDIDVVQTVVTPSQEKAKSQHATRSHTKDSDEKSPVAADAKKTEHVSGSKDVKSDVAVADVAVAGEKTKLHTASAYFSLLARTKADTFTITGLPANSPIWICNRDDKVTDVLKGMIQRNILSVPVLLKSDKYYGFIDLMDVVSYAVKHFGSKSLAKERAFFELVDEEREFQDKSVKDLMMSPNMTRNPYHPISAGYSAFAVVEALAREPGLHRVPIVAKDRTMVNLVTQTQLIKFLAEHIDTLGDVTRLQIKDCPRMINNVVSVTESATALSAFELMVQHNIHGVAIVNEETGRLRGNLSLRDLKICGADMSLFWRLQQSVKNYVTKLRHEFQVRHDRPRVAVYVTPSTSLYEVITALAKHGIHRLYVCDDHASKKPIGVVTLQDVLLQILEA